MPTTLLRPPPGGRPPTRPTEPSGPPHGQRGSPSEGSHVARGSAGLITIATACQTPAVAAALPDAEARVLAAVDEAWAVDLLCRTIAVPSVGGTDAECAIQHLVADELTTLGCDVDRWQIDLAAAATAPDAPGQEVERAEAW